MKNKIKFIVNILNILVHYFIYKVLVYKGIPITQCDDGFVLYCSVIMVFVVNNFNEFKDLIK